MNGIFNIGAMKIFKIYILWNKKHKYNTVGHMKPIDDFSLHCHIILR